jgi:hypothetical protein
MFFLSLLLLIIKDRDMLKTFGNFQVELSGSLVSIKQNGSLVKAQSVSPNYAVQEFEKICTKVESYVLQNA